VLDSIAARIDRARRAAGRATLVPFVVRCGIALAFVLAMSVAGPAEIAAGRYLAVLFLVAVYPALAPRGRGATIAVLVAVGGWIADTTWYDARIALWRVLTLATCLYLGHTLTALAAVLPYDALVNLDVLTGWLTRALAVILISAVLTVIALGLSSDLAGGAFLIATLVGLAGAVSATLLLTRLLRRP
jgi:hypothetical protein